MCTIQIRRTPSERVGSKDAGVWVAQKNQSTLRWGFVFFFFQAEDGIRDLTVTGVQTCALPICGSVRALTRSAAVRCGSSASWASGWRRVSGGLSNSVDHTPGFVQRLNTADYGARSEERRVGKEGRSRWSPYH